MRRKVSRKASLFQNSVLEASILAVSTHKEQTLAFARIVCSALFSAAAGEDFANGSLNEFECIAFFLARKLARPHES